VYWTTIFKVQTKKASGFLASAKKLIKKKCGFDWEVSTDVGKRVTKVYLFAPSFGYRVDLSTPYEKIREAEKLFNKLIDETKRELLHLAKKYGAKVEVFNGCKKEVFVDADTLIEAEAVEEEAVKVVARALKKINADVEKFPEILSIDSIVQQAKRELSPIFSIG